MMGVCGREKKRVLRFTWERETAVSSGEETSLHPNLISVRAQPGKTLIEKESLKEILRFQTTALKILCQPLFAVCLAVTCHHFSLALTTHSRVKVR